MNSLVTRSKRRCGDVYTFPVMPSSLTIMPAILAVGSSMISRRRRPEPLTKKVAPANSGTVAGHATASIPFSYISDPLPGDDYGKKRNPGGKSGLGGSGVEDPAECTDQRSAWGLLRLWVGREFHLLYSAGRGAYRSATFARREPTSQIGPGNR